MIEVLYRRKIIREVLNQFSSRNWNIIIPILVEIGILFIKQHHNIGQMNIEKFKEVLCKYFLI
jgi:hypothetical protein